MSLPFVQRFATNPLIKPADVTPSRPDLEVMCAFNAGATTYQGQTLLLVRIAERPRPTPGYISTAIADPEKPGEYKMMRVKTDAPDLDARDPRVFKYQGVNYLTSVSHLRLARSTDGRHFTVDKLPAMMPTGPREEYGIEDPRIALIGSTYYVTYSAISRDGITTCIASTRDFVKYERHGVMFAPDNKDIAIFPLQVGGKYYAFHRPSPGHFGRPSMWIASSPNLLDWGGHRLLCTPRQGYWDSERVGCGASPILTPRGWLQFHHGSDFNIRYCMGAMLLDAEQPWRILKRDTKPLLEPEADYELKGFMPNVIFSNGLVSRPDGKVDVFYGATDETTCGATIDVNAVLDWLG